MAEAKMQHCDYCGAEMGVFAHSKRLEGPLSCGKRECDRYAQEAERDAADEERRQRQEREDYSGGFGGSW